VVKFDEATGAPLNPYGRTGLTGRGLLGKWGPNHAADPIVTRWEPLTGHLQVLAISA
jgi:ADP-ribose pyrophosphatase